jgi:TolB-like protein/tetratricopeptide (TPR) repeat protein
LSEAACAVLKPPRKDPEKFRNGYIRLMPGQPIAFGPFLLTSDNGTLLRDGKLVAVGQRGALLLGALLKNPGQVRTKAELMDAAWPGTAVEESNLSVQIASLRKLLGPSPDGGEWIATIPRVGYRLVAEPEATMPVQTQAAYSEPVLPSLAVLPFHNLSGDPEQDYFADGVVEDIITALSRFKSFAVIARNSSFVYKGRAVDVRQVAKDLGVRYVLEGSIRRAGERLRITAQLVDGTSGAHLWADKFDGVVKDVFDVQDRITESVVVVVEPHIRQAEIERSRRKPPENLDAYDLYLRALAKIYMTQPVENAEANALLMRAVALEPNYAPFLVHAGWTFETRVIMGWPTLTGDDRTASLDLVRRAVANARGDGAVLAPCGAALLHMERDYERGMQIVANALEANPNNQMVLIFAAVANLHCGSLEESLALSRRAILMSPRDPSATWPMTVIAHAQMALGKYEEALKAAERSLAVNPNYPPTYWMLISANAQLGRMDEARRWLAKFRALAPDVTIAGIREGQPAKDPSRLAAILEGLRLAGLDEG